jgi:hypothetical protein
VVVGQLLDVVLDETVDVPLEHWAGDVEPKFFDNVLVDPFGVRRAAHAFDTQELKVAFLEVVEVVTREHVVNSKNRGRH